MKISSAFPSKYLKAADLPEGRDVFVKIDDVQMEVMEQQSEEKPVCYFIDKQKGLVLNSTNATAIANAFGDDTETWHGRTIALFATTTNFGGRVVPCIRVRVPRPAAAQPAPAPVPQPEPQETENADFGDAGLGDDCPF